MPSNPDVATAAKHAILTQPGLKAQILENSLPSAAPAPSLPDHAARQDLIARIQEDGPMRFDEFMRLALYHPHYGYYTRGDRIFGAQGDFVTAPGLSPLFGKTIGKAFQQALSTCRPVIYEFGAGDGRLASDLLSVLGDTLEAYFIVDLSGGLKAQQQERLQRELPFEVACKVQWITELPDSLEGLVIGNELLDAMPVRRFSWTQEGVFETHVQLSGEPGGLMCVDLPADPQLAARVEALRQAHGPWPSPYYSEIAEQACAWVETITHKLKGLCLMVDYGRDASHYFSPHCSGGFLRAHSQHVAHDGFLEGIGLQDLTCHVNFTEVYDAIVAAGGELEGYCTQSAFLRHHGITDLAAADPQFLDPLLGGPKRQALNMLLSEAEMGENFKFICWSKDLTLAHTELHAGFIAHDLSHLL